MNVRAIRLLFVVACGLAGCGGSTNAGPAATSAQNLVPAVAQERTRDEARPSDDGSPGSIPSGEPSAPPALPPGTTTNADIPHPVPTQPNSNVAAYAGSCGGCSGAPDADYSYPNAPAGGYDAIELTMSPQRYDGTTSNATYFWAYEDYFGKSQTFYFGLQPAGQYGKTALFSVFGKGTSHDKGYAYCFGKADDGAGTSCHVPYAFETRTFYDFTVVLVGQTATTRTWEGRVYDDAARTSTLIGDITVTNLHGINGGGNEGAFDEYFSGCRNHNSFSEILYLIPVPYSRGTPFPGAVAKSGLVRNSACGPAEFYSDFATYVFLDQGNT